jgi:hypothetical protein
MSGFEFVLVLYAIISGLGISDILRGWGEQVRVRHRMSAYPLQLALSFFLMYFGITFLWSLWTFRDAEWTFLLYITGAIVPLLLSLASGIIRVDPAIGAPTAKDQYFQVARPIFLILSCIPILIIVGSFTTYARELVPNRPEGMQFMLLTIYRVLLSVGMLYVAWSKKASVHWIGVSVMFLTVIMLNMRLTVRSIDGAF